MNNDDNNEQRVRSVIAEHAALASDPQALAATDDLYQAGMTSHASVNVMLALEDTFDIEFPDAMLTREVFASIAAIAAAIADLTAEEQAA